MILYSGMKPSHCHVLLGHCHKQQEARYISAISRISANTSKLVAGKGERLGQRGRISMENVHTRSYLSVSYPVSLLSSMPAI